MVAPLPVRFTITPAVTSPSQLITWEYESFTALLDDLQPQPAQSKADVDLMVPVAEWHELHRVNRNIKIFGRLFMADFDRLPDEAAQTVLDVAKTLSCVVYTTGSHLTAKKGHTNCFRVLIELDCEYPAGEHLTLWDTVNVLFGGHLDPQTRTLHTPYYLPAQFMGSPFMMHRFSGRVLPAPTTGAMELAPPQPREALIPTGEPTNPATLQAAIQSWANYRGAQPERLEKAETAKDAKLILGGKAPRFGAGEGRRHSFMVSLAGFLARQFPNADPVGLCELFQTVGWDQFAAGDLAEHGIPRLVRMVEDFQALELEQLTRLIEEREAEQKRAILEATGGERDHLIAQEETDALEVRYGAGWPQMAVLQYRNGFFLLQPDGTYHERMWDRNELLVASRDHFMVFGDHVSLIYEDERTEEMRRHSYESFRNSYCTAVVDTWYDQALTETCYDPLGKKLAIACAVPQVKPVYHEDVQAWLMQAGGTLLVDLAAGLSRLDEMMPALVLTGVSGRGKTLFALGIGRIWGCAPNDPRDTHTKFNDDQMRRQPITLHDEKAGEAFTREGTSLVRQYTTQGERWIEGKNLPKVRLKGFPRLIFAANNPHILDTQESMTSADRAAFAERLIHVEFQSSPPETAVVKNDWLGKDHLAEHAYWLGLNWAIQHPGQRFLVQGPRTLLHEGLAGGAGTAAEVVQWLLSYVANPTRVTATGDCPLEISTEGHYLRVTAAAVLQHWEIYLKSQIPRRTSEVQIALRSISANGFQKIMASAGGGKKIRVNAYDIDLQILRASLDRHHLTEEGFDSALGLEP